MWREYLKCIGEMSMEIGRVASHIVHVNSAMCIYPVRAMWWCRASSKDRENFRYLLYKHLLILTAVFVRVVEVDCVEVVG